MLVAHCTVVSYFAVGTNQIALARSVRDAMRISFVFSSGIFRSILIANEKKLVKDRHVLAVLKTTDGTAAQ